MALEADLRSQDIDVCVVSETHLSTNMPDAVVKSQITMCSAGTEAGQNRTKGKKGGVAVYVRDSLKSWMFTGPIYMSLLR